MSTGETETTSATTLKTRECPVCGVEMPLASTGRKKVACSQRCRRIRQKALLEDTLAAKEVQLRDLLREAVSALDMHLAQRQKR